MESAPRSNEAPRFPLPGDAEVTQTYNVRAIRIARKPLSLSREPKLQEDRAVLIHHGIRPLAPGLNDLAIFELLDAGQSDLFTRVPGGLTAMARRMSWLIRTAPGPRAWLRIVPLIHPNATFGVYFLSDMRMLLTEWMLLESQTRSRRLAAVCHGLCMPDYGFSD